jgi:hypothetical protein
MRERTFELGSRTGHTHGMRVVCFEIELVQNSPTPYCGRVQWLSTDVGRLLVGGIVTACLALDLVGMTRTVHGGLNDLVLVGRPGCYDGLTN